MHLAGVPLGDQKWIDRSQIGWFSQLICQFKILIQIPINLFIVGWQGGGRCLWILDMDSSPAGDTQLWCATTHIHLLIIMNERPSRIRVRDNLIYTGTLHQHHRHRRYHTDRWRTAQSLWMLDRFPFLPPLWICFLAFPSPAINLNAAVFASTQLSPSPVDGKFVTAHTFNRPEYVD